DDLQPAVVEQRPHIGAHRLHHVDLLGGRACAQRRAREAGTFTHERREIQLALATFLQPDHDDVSTGGQYVDVAREVGGADDVEHDVCAVPGGGVSYDLDEVLLVVVHEDVGTQLSA